MCGSGFRPPETEVVRGSLVEAALEGGCAYGSNIWQSRTDVGEAWAMGAFPRSGVASRSGVLRLTWVLALSGVRDRSDVLHGAGDWPLPDRTDPVLFRRTWEERVLSGAPYLSRSGALPELVGWEVPLGWLGPASIGEVGNSATSPTTSYTVPVGDP